MKKYFLSLALSFLVCLPLWAKAITVSGVDILNDNGSGTYFVGNVSGLDPKKYYDAIISLRYPAQNPTFSVGLGGRGDVVNNKFKVFIKDVNLTPTLRPIIKLRWLSKRIIALSAMKNNAVTSALTGEKAL